MSMIKTVYDIPSLKLDMRLVEETLTTAINTGSLVPDEMNRVLLTHDTGLLKDIPSFVHPFKLSTAKGTYLVLDVRYYVRQMPNGDLTVTHPADLQLNVMRLLLNDRWIRETPISLLSAVPSSLAAYATWFAQAFTNKLNDFELLEFKLIAAIYYYSQFVDGDQFKEADEIGAISMISRHLKVPTSGVKDKVEKIGKLNTLNDFVQAVKNDIQSVRVQSLNQGLVVSLLLNSWFGIQAKELVASAINFPPSWIAFVFMGLVSKGHHKTKIAQAVNHVVHRNDTVSTSRSIATLVDFDLYYQHNF